MIEVKDFYKLLETKGLLEIKEPSWEKIEVCHGKECLDHYKVDEHKHLRTHFNDRKGVSGLYAYFRGNYCIYIGKSKNLRERIYQHMLESCGAWGHPRYQAVFGNYPGLIDLYLLQLGDSTWKGNYLRSITEKILQIHHEPELQSIMI